jgi:protein TonB
LTAGSRVPSGPFTAIQLDRIPRATVQQPPDYPATMHQNGITGSVTVEFEVDTEGRVIRAEAIHYTHREFAGPAVREVLQWRFEPGKRNGRPVPFRMAIPIEFSLPAE